MLKPDFTEVWQEAQNVNGRSATGMRSLREGFILKGYKNFL